MEITLLDGAIGQELVNRSEAEPTELWSTSVMLEKPGLLDEVHAEYFSVGASVATTNTYSVLHGRLKRAGVSGYNQPKRTPNHPTKSHIVVAKSGSTIKTIRFGQQGAKTAGKPKAGESRKTKMKRKSFKARHAKNIAKGVLSAAYWANKVKW